MSYPGHSFGGGLTPLQRCSQCILQPQPTGQYRGEEMDACLCRRWNANSFKLGFDLSSPSWFLMAIFLYPLCFHPYYGVEPCTAKNKLKMHVFILACIYSTPPPHPRFDFRIIIKRSKTGLTSEFFLLLDWLPNQSWRTQFVLLLSHRWQENRWLTDKQGHLALCRETWHWLVWHTLHQVNRWPALTNSTWISTRAWHTYIS